MLSAERTIFVEFKSFFGFILVFHFVVVSLFAFLACKCDFYSHFTLRGGNFFKTALKKGTSRPFRTFIIPHVNQKARFFLAFLKKLSPKQNRIFRNGVFYIHYISFISLNQRKFVVKYYCDDYSAVVCIAVRMVYNKEYKRKDNI